MTTTPAPLDRVASAVAAVLALLADPDDQVAAQRLLDAVPALKRSPVSVPDPPAAVTLALSQTHRQVLAMAAQGDTTRAIARRLTCSQATVHRRLREIRNALGADSRTHAITLAQAAGLVSTTHLPPVRVTIAAVPPVGTGGAPRGRIALAQAVLNDHGHTATAAALVARVLAGDHIPHLVENRPDPIGAPALPLPSR